MPVIFLILIEPEVSLGVLEQADGAERVRGPHAALPGTAGSRAGKAQAAAGSWGQPGLTSCCSNSLQLSVEAVQMGRRHRKALTSCERMPPPCSGGMSITGTVGNLLPLLSKTLPHMDRWTHAGQVLQLQTYPCVSRLSSPQKVQAKVWQTPVSLPCNTRARA